MPYPGTGKPQAKPGLFVSDPATVRKAVEDRVTGDRVTATQVRLVS